MEDERSGFKRRQLHYSPNLLSSINNAIENNRIIEIEYDSHEKGVSNRSAEPMAIVYKNRKRNLVAWCRLRDDYRAFRLDRINTIKVMLENFDPRSDLDISQYEDGEESEDYDDAEEEGF